MSGEPSPLPTAAGGYLAEPLSIPDRRANKLAVIRASLSLSLKASENEVRARRWEAVIGPSAAPGR
jgi:hypothetical protein